MTAILGLDLGTSSAKGVLCERGAVLARSSCGYPTQRRYPGWVEQDPRDWLAATVRVCRELANHPAWQRLSAVGVSGQMHTCVLVDGRGSPIRNAIVWQDTRSQGVIDALSPEQRAEIERITSNPAHTILTLFPLCWLARTMSETLRAAHKVLVAKDFLRFAFTGCMTTDRSDASGAGLLDTAALRWSDWLVQLAGLRPEQLPEIVPSSASAPVVTNDFSGACSIPSGTQCVAGAGDLASETFSLSMERPVLVLRLGTAGAIITPADRPRRGRHHCYAGVGDDEWLLVGGTQTCGAAMEWAGAELLGGLDYEQCCELAATSAPGARGLIFVPHLAGERAPYFDANRRGSLHGLSLEHTRADIARAVLEGIVFSLRDAMRSLPIAPAGAPIAVIGATARHPLWRQVLADALDQPVAWRPDAGPAFGAARIAAGAVGDASPIKPITPIITNPQPTAAAYQPAFSQYLETIDASIQPIR